MTNITSRKKILDKNTEKASHPKSRLIDIALHDDMLNSSADASCISNQDDRGRIIIFIDGANLFYAASKLNIEVDYAKLLHYLTGRNCLVHVFFYTGADPTNEKQQRFLQWMSHHGFRVITKAVTQDVNSAKKANLDVEIAIDMMRLAQHCDTAVLVSGDGDFVYVVNAVVAQGVRVEVVGLRSMTSCALIDVANCYIDLASIQLIIQKGDERADQSLVIFQN